MAKRSQVLNKDQKTKEGKGLGQGQDYRPWITIQDFPSSGRVSRIKGIKTKRQHEFLSDLERNYFYFLEFSDKVIDIREQYPLLPLEETLLIAKELGIQHPEHPQTGEPIVITTDFLITINAPMGEINEVARTVKYKEKLFEQRVLEKFEIERVYFEKHGIDWAIVTENEVDKIVAQNIADLHGYQNLNEIEGFKSIEPQVLQDMVEGFISRAIDYKGSLRNLCNSFDTDMQLIKGNSIALLKYLLINKILLFDITQGLNLNKSLELKINIEKYQGRAEIG